MTIPFPGFDFTAPAQATARSGLYDAATQVVDVPGTEPRIAGGVVIWPTNCGPSGTWPTDLCPAPPGTPKGGDRPDNSENFLPVNAWGWDECGNLAAPENEERARQNLAINEPLYVESAFADRIVADAGAATAAVSIVDAIGMLEADLAEAGLVGVIHASPYWTDVAFAVNMLRWVGSKLQTQRGTAWADGGGYVGPLANTLVATGQVFIWKGAVTVSERLEYRTNRKIALAERTVLAGYEPCLVSAVTVPALTNGGGSGGGSGLVYPSA